MSATQPITLITATPGGGKTALAVQMMKAAVDQGRPLFVMGIPELKLPYIPTPAVSDWTELREDPENPGMMLPYFTFPPNSLIVLDEAQRVFRVRTAGSKVPDHVAAFETVRHTGVTFVLITQNPTFLDSHIRKLVGQHVHLRDAGLLGRWYYEWPECANPETFNTAPIKKKWSLPKSSFGLYKSSSLHIKRKYTVPPVLMLFIACVLIAAFLAYRVYYRTGQLTTATPAKPVAAEQGRGGVASAPAVAVKAGPSAAATDGAEILAAFVPAVSGRPETAPAYAQLRQIRSMPTVIGGACTSTRCTCYTAQGTDAGLDDMQCREWIRKPPFDPYREPQAAQEPISAQLAPATAQPEKTALKSAEGA
ncbi:zonular occludens toxin [Ralstonia pseudosolanacearum]|uniref:zonular occludens toxin domain-containing protein n=1 Tax=Ralstonia pseudosolanacearum TaxID=1310165 RepID=UPI001C8BBBE1|nr:zonular occludens toxin domain-containing protein [Ralstonia pseudosolanacearum]MBX9432250.1 zonular occludens toxin [Ralstonia pseudosolanacearum]